MPNEYSDLIAEDKTSDLRQSVYVGARQQPDVEAKFQALSQRTGVPLEAVRLKAPEVELHDRLQSFDYEKAIKDSPKLSAWMADPKNAGVAHDDFDNLTGLEKTLNFGANFGRAVAASLPRANAGLWGVGRAVGDVLPDVIGDPIANFAAKYQKGAMETAKWVRGDQKGAGFVEKSIYSGAESLGQNLMMLPAAILTGSPAPMLATMGATTGGEAYGQARDKGVSVSQSLVFGASQAAIEVATESIPAIKLLRDTGLKTGFGRMLKNQMLAEIPGEQAATVLQDMNEWAVLNPEKPFKDYLAERPSAAAQTLIATMVGTGGQVAVTQGLQRVVGGDVQAQNEAFFKALAEGATNSKLRERLPDRFKELVAKYTEDGPVQNVFIPADKFSQYFQSVQIDPVQAAEEAGALNFQEALASGGDVVIPMADFATHIAPTDHLGGLMQDLRLRQDEMTGREAKLAEANRDQTDKELAAEIERINKGVGADAKLDQAIQRIVSDVEGQLSTRYDLNTARQMATVMRGMAVLATRANPNADPVEAAQALWNKYGLNIRANPLPDVLTKAPDFDAAIDPMLDRLRKGDIPKQADIFGKSLVEWLREQGGIQDGGGELARMDTELWDKENRKGGQRRLVNQDGMTFDAARELAAQMGYQVGETERDFIDALSAEIGGNPIYKMGGENSQMQSVADTLEQLSKALSEMGVDLTQMDNAAVKKLLMGGENEFEQTLPATIEIDGIQRSTVNSNGKQIAQTEEGIRNFWKWFGDSKVVDAEGRPFVVYHGTASDFSVFDVSSPDKFDAGFLGRGFYFTSSVETADNYAGFRLSGNAESNIMPVFLRMNNPLKITHVRGMTKSQVMAKSLAIEFKGDDANTTAEAEMLRDAAIEQGYDGVIYQYLHDEKEREYVTFSNTQIKSATGNNGEFDPANASILNQDRRGSIQFGADRKFQINLFEKADLSTFLHESGHFYLEVMGDLASDPNADQSVKDDYAKILAFLGVSNRDEIQVEHHEKFARANEAYLFEGNAPAPELRGVFQRFRAWLKVIYRQLQSLNVELSDEVRGVFDRIYATDNEIEQASREANIAHLFADAASAGMTEAEFAAYSDRVADTTAEAKETLQTKLMRVEKLKREAWWREQRKAVAKEVAREFDDTPAAQAFDVLTAGDSELKLNRSALTARYGEQILKQLPRGYGEGRGAVYTDNGADLDSVAEVSGFESSDAMISALVNMPNRKKYIAAESDRRMMERHGDLLNDVALADEAMLALHNEKREQVLRIELRQMRKMWKDAEPALKLERAKQKDQTRAAVDLARQPAPEQLRQIASGIIGQKQVRDINPHSYLLAEKKAARAAFEAMAKRDIMQAATEKQRELLNHYLYREATRAKEDSDAILKYMKSFESDSVRGKLGKAGDQYLSQIDGILERYEFKRVTNRDLSRRDSLSAWLTEQEAQGNAVNVPAEVMDDSRRVNYRTVPIDELRAVRDAVKNIAHLANLKTKLVRKGKLVEFQDVVGELLAAVDSAALTSTGEYGKPNTKSDGILTKAAGAWRKFDAAHMKVEQIVEWLDGGKINGPWARFFFDLADDAQTQEYDLHRLVTQEIEKLSGHLDKKTLFDRTTVSLAGFNQPMTRYDLISIAMNMGNAQNMQRLMDGYGWTQADIQRVRDGLSLSDWRFVQGVWDAIDQLWTPMAALEKRASGLEPERVVPVEFEANGETFRGGYFPLVYDPRRSNAGEKQADEAESVQNFVAQGYGRAATNKGATKKRAEQFSAPVLLDYEHVITSHTAKVIKDISHREAVIGLNKILTQGQIKEALIDKLGEAQYTEFRKWMQVLVNDRSDSLTQATGAAKWMMKFRTNTAIVTMGFKISTMMAQIAGIGPTLDVVRPRDFAKALTQFVQSPRQTWEFVTSKSGEMRNRSNTIERDVRDSLLRMRGEGGMLADVRRHAFILTSMADRTVSAPTWLAGYNGALADGLAEEDAIRAGDRAVRLSQGAGGSKDLAAVQRNGELMRLLTMYYTPFSVLYARLRDMGHQFQDQGISYLPAAAARLIALVILPAVMGDLLAGRGPDDDEDEVWWAIRKVLLYPVATLPVIRDFSGYMEAGIISASGEGQMKFPPSYKLSPIVGAIEKTLRVGGNILGGSDSKSNSEIAWDAFEVSGYMFGLPTAQPRITGEYLADLISGDADPENAPQLLHDVLFRREKK